MRRVAIVAVPAPLADHRASPGALDGDAMRSRLAQPDTRFEVVAVDPNDDFALQIEDFFDKNALTEEDELLLYASSAVMTSVEGELFVCLDPGAPDTGDSLRDISLVVGERFRGRALLFLECRHQPDPADPFRSVALVGVAKDMVRPRETGIGLLVAARPLDPEGEGMPSPLTRAFLSAIDASDPAAGLTMEQFYEDAVEELAGVVPGFAHVRGRGGFQLLAAAPRTISPPEDAGGAVKAAPTTHRSGAPPPDPDMAPPSDRRVSAPPMALPQDRSFQRAEEHLPKVIVSDRPPPPSVRPPPAAAPPQAVAAPRVVGGPTSAASPARTIAEHLEVGDRAAAANDPEAALGAYKRALVLMAPAVTHERAQIYVRIGNVKRDQHKRREAISQYEKALSIVPTHAEALESLLDLNAREGDWRAVMIAEDKVLAMVDDPDATFTRLVDFGSRWQRLAMDDTRARALLEMASAMKPSDLGVLDALARLYERGGQIEDLLKTRIQLADLAPTPRGRAEAYGDLGSYALLELKQEDFALELFDKALDADPSLLDPLTIVARLLAERQEWSELEAAYRRMLDRAPRIPEADVRSEVTWELCRRLATLFRDHLDDPALALDAFEDALEEKPDDLQTRITAAGLARSIGAHERAIPHLQAIVALDPLRLDVYHALFELFQRLRRPDAAYATACVTMHLRAGETRERIIFDEHKPAGVPALTRPLRPEAWDLLRVADRDRNVEAVLEAVTAAGVAARLAQLAAEGKLPALDPAARQDPQRSTASIVRSFTWASHFLGVPAPAIYVHDDAQLPIATVIAEEPTVIAGGGALRGRTLTELAFLVGRHLSYHVKGHRLVLYYPSLEELSAFFVAAVKIASPDVPMPPTIEAAATALMARLEPRLTAEDREHLVVAVRAFEAEKRRANLAAWVASVERFATRAGYLVAGDLDAAVGILRADPRGIVDAEAKAQDLYAFAVSDAYHSLREELGIAVEP